MLTKALNYCKKPLSTSLLIGIITKKKQYDSWFELVSQVLYEY